LVGTSSEPEHGWDGRVSKAPYLRGSNFFLIIFIVRLTLNFVVVHILASRGVCDAACIDFNAKNGLIQIFNNTDSIWFTQNSSIKLNVA